MPALILLSIPIRKISMKKYRFLILLLNLEEYTALMMRALGRRKSFRSPKDLGYCKRHFKGDFFNTKKILLFRISKKDFRCTLEEAMASIMPFLTR
jgi:hypothetical protein